jgi:hypothetical protein
MLHAARLLADAFGQLGISWLGIDVNKQVNRATITVLGPNRYLLERKSPTFFVFIREIL